MVFVPVHARAAQPPLDPNSPEAMAAADAAAKSAEDATPIALAVMASIAAVAALAGVLVFLARTAGAQGPVNAVAPAVSATVETVVGASAGTAATQGVEQFAFLILRGNDTVAVERVTRGRASLSGELAVRGGPGQKYIAELATGPSVPVLTIQLFSPGAAPDAAPAQTATMRIGRDSVVIEGFGGRQQRRSATAVTSPPLPFINLSFALGELMLAQARRAGVAAFDGKFVIIANTPVLFDARVEFVGSDSAAFTTAGVLQRVRVDADGRILGGSVPAQGLMIVRVTGAAAMQVSLGRPDYGAPAGAPYTAEEVTVPTRAGHSLTGTLTRPLSATGRVPAVVTITGSGQQDRDESISLVAGYRPFRQLADTLGRRGIAVLRLDDRGINGSGGDVTKATSADFADDIRAGVAFLRARPDIDPDRIALVGHSEGGVIAPMVAATDSKLAGIVLTAGPAYSGRKIIDFQLRNLVMGDARIPAALKDSAVAASVAQWDSTSGKAPWMRFFMDYDPLATLRRVQVPVLIVQGGTDQQVTPDQAPILERTLREAGNRQVTMRVFADRNHLLLSDPVGFPGNYGSLKDPRIPADVMGSLAEWLVTTLRVRTTP